MREEIDLRGIQLAKDIQIALESKGRRCTGSVEEMLENLEISKSTIRPWLADPGGNPYGRKCLFRSPEWECLLMTWKSFQVCSPHDHGASTGWIFVVEGNLQNQSYSLHKSSGVLQKKASKCYEVGQLFRIGNGEVHDMKSLTKDLITLHIYNPPIVAMRVFNLEKCLSCVVADDCGAWWPNEQKSRFDEMKLRFKGH